LHLKFLEASRDRLIDLAHYVENCPKDKGEEKSKDTADKIQTAKLMAQRG
jgi:hypothetical protein